MTFEETMALPDGIYDDIREDWYHKIPRVSSTYLRKLAKNPALTQVQEEETEAMSLGSLVHCIVLEGKDAFRERYAVLPDIPHHKNSNAYKSEMAAFCESNVGKEIVDGKQMDVALGCANAIKDHPLASLLLAETQGKPEVSILWTDAETGIKMKCRIDRLPSPRTRALIDLKTTSDSSRSGFLRSIAKYAYDVQSSVYLRGARSAGIQADSFIFVACQTSPPYQVLTCMLDDAWIAYADAEVSRLLMIEAECRELGFYPNYELPSHCCSITQIIEAQGNDLLEVFELPKWR